MVRPAATFFLLCSSFCFIDHRKEYVYQEALTWFLGGEEKVLQQVPLTRGGILLGRQALPSLSPDVAFRMTAATEHLDRLENHLRRFLALTPLRALQWINFNQEEIELVTLGR